MMLQESQCGTEIQSRITSLFLFNSKDKTKTSSTLKPTLRCNPINSPNKSVKFSKKLELVKIFNYKESPVCISLPSSPASLDDCWSSEDEESTNSDFGCDPHFDFECDSDTDYINYIPNFSDLEMYEIPNQNSTIQMPSAEAEYRYTQNINHRRSTLSYDSGSLFKNDYSFPSYIPSTTHKNNPVSDLNFKLIPQNFQQNQNPSSLQVGELYPRKSNKNIINQKIKLTSLSIKHEIGTGSILHGIVKVNNLSYVKEFQLKLTNDHWKTNIIIEKFTFLKGTKIGSNDHLHKEHKNNSKPRMTTSIDEFYWEIPLFKTISNECPLNSTVDPSRSLKENTCEIELCFSYKVNGATYWDNNDGDNYRAFLQSTSLSNNDDFWFDDYKRLY